MVGRPPTASNQRETDIGELKTFCVNFSDAYLQNGGNLVPESSDFVSKQVSTL